MKQTEHTNKLMDLVELDAVRRMFISRSMYHYTRGNYTLAMQYQLLAYDAGSQWFELEETMTTDEVSPMYDLWRM